MHIVIDIWEGESQREVVCGIIGFTMSNTLMSVEQIWDNLLSREPGSVRAAYSTLDKEEQAAVLSHLRKMASEPGWHPEQKKSADIALEELGEPNH